MEGLSPNIFVSNMQQTIAFYQVLGFEVSVSVPDRREDPVWAMVANAYRTITTMY
ncbi:MAG: glyoxalase [Mucilaginibacter sp.]|nr:glyoxalase [Mucilaginibacter sp.]